ncbi:MAG: cysteine protease StiP family protein [Candidatus Saccharibacteria bacterium]|nr:cysteine protease StiP family protein [Pseudorhodobacter sp.]
MLVPPTSQIAETLSARPAPLPIGTARSGSYVPDDVRFLLNVVDLPAVGLDEKERLIQSGQRHYSEMISAERHPDARYLALFDQACQTSIPRIAREMAGIAGALAGPSYGPRRRLALCSLVRAGVPYGVILARALKQRGVDVTHFGVSIIRDKGLDANAMKAVLQQFLPEEVVFVDGWTGKGAIAGELDRSWRALTGLNPCLVVLSDPCGHAQISGSHEDWLIPTGLLGGIVSGLVSRSIRNDSVVGKTDFDGCLLLDNMGDLDRSRSFVDGVSDAMALCRDVAAVQLPDPAITAVLRAASQACIDRILGEFAVPSRNLIKPGIAEATRAVLRRRPERVFLGSADDPDVAALRHLCEVDGLDITIDPTLTGPYRAVTLIRRTL